MFDLVQHKPMNKRLIYILMEYFLQNFFLNQSAQTSQALPSSPMFPNMPIVSSPSLTAYYLTSPLTNLIRLHLSKSSKVKSEWRLNVKRSTSESLNLNDKAITAYGGGCGGGNTTMSSSASNGSIGSSSSAKLNSGMHHHQYSHSQSVLTNKTNNSDAGAQRGSIPKSKSFYNEVNC
jgi:hypothetical protein